jgi:hypothetical protein
LRNYYSDRLVLSLNGTIKRDDAFVGITKQELSELFDEKLDFQDEDYTAEDLDFLVDDFMEEEADIE